MFHESTASRDCALTQAITASILSRGTGHHPARVAAERYGSESLSVRALLATEGGFGGYLVPSELYQAQVIAALTPLTIVRRHTPVQNILPLRHGNLTIGRVDAPPAVGFIGEDVATPAATGTAFGDITLVSHKIMATQPISNDLIRSGSPEIENVVRDLLLREFAVVEDAAYLAGPGSEFSPKEIMASAATKNTATASPTNAQIISDLQGLVSALTAAKVPMLSPVFFMPPNLREFLLTLTNTSGNFQFPEVSDGRLMGIPVASSTSVPAGVVMLVDMSEFILAQSELDITVAPGATYTNGSGDRVSAFDLDQSVLKIVMGIDCALKHSASAACLVSIPWAA